MSDKPSHWCVFLPCSSSEIWALPQNCVAEIVVMPAEAECPPQHINWRNQEVPVLDLNDGGDLPWRERHGGSGLIAVMLGLKGEGCDYWAVALRGTALSMKDIADEDIEDCPDMTLARSVGAFRLHGEVYQIPDLLELQREITADRMTA